MLLSVLLSMLLAEDQLQKVIIHHLLTKESMRSFGTSLGLQDTRTVENGFVLNHSSKAI